MGGAEGAEGLSQRFERRTRDPDDSILLVWFVLVALSVIYVAWDNFGRGNPEPAVMRWG